MKPIPRPNHHYRIVWVHYGVKRTRYHGYLTHPQVISDIEYPTRYAAEQRAQAVYDFTHGKIQAVALVRVIPKEQPWRGSTAPSKAGVERRAA